MVPRLVLDDPKKILFKNHFGMAIVIFEMLFFRGGYVDGRSLRRVLYVNFFPLLGRLFFSEASFGFLDKKDAATF